MEKKPKPDTRWNRLARVLTHVSTILTITAREQWHIHTNFDKSPSDLFTCSSESWTFTGIHPPSNTGCIVIREYFHFSPQMWTVCDSHVTPAHVRNLHPWAQSSHTKWIFALKPNYTTPSIRGNRNYIIYEWRQIPVLRCFQETLEIDLKSKGLQALEANPVCHLLSLTFSPVSLFSCTYSCQRRSREFYELAVQFSSIAADKNHLFILKSFPPFKSTDKVK